MHLQERMHLLSPTVLWFLVFTLRYLWRRRRRRPRDLRHAPLVRVELDGVDDNRDAEEVGDTQEKSIASPRVGSDTEDEIAEVARIVHRRIR